MVVAGGQENMSRAPHATYLRNGVKFGNCDLIDTLIKDGLTDAFHNIHMAITGKTNIPHLHLMLTLYIFIVNVALLAAENLAEKYAINREAQDNYASKSQRRTEAAITAGYFDKEIVPVIITNKAESIVISKDEFPKFGTTAEKLAKLRPAFRPVCIIPVSVKII